LLYLYSINGLRKSKLDCSSFSISIACFAEKNTMQYNKNNRMSVIC